MQPLVNPNGNAKALDIAQRAKQTGVTEMFNSDPQVSVDNFSFYNDYDFIHPDTTEIHKNAFATLVRECVHFEVETYASMLTFGFDLGHVYPTMVVSYMTNSCRAILKDKFNVEDNAIIESFAKRLVQEVYKFIQPKLDLPDMNWNVSARSLS
ncbi:hypothetical protein JL09_g5614 [Pichia kudriavzevii]|uniref:Uncharacterized protein n=1 Tax=Pichia kudriavzevii TaxID=4909 RepID=A0A099NTM5_PICKU|nr:hypothetical protein JL09_g5614 [Pichia kudriavzevii]